jgi:hypothetical protein
MWGSEVEQQLRQEVEAQIEQMIASGKLSEEERGESVDQALQVARQQLQEAMKKSTPLV